MKIKKKTSLMLAAASMAAIMGVAAVSFAKWTGGSDSLTASASTGHVDLTGFTSNAPTLNALYPVDQGDSYNTVESFEVTYLVTEDSQKITAKYEITTDGAAADAELELWVKIDSAAATDVKLADVTTANGWKQLTKEGIDLVPSITKSNAEVSQHVSLVLVSGDSTDMDQSFDLTLEIVDA